MAVLTAGEMPKSSAHSQMHRSCEPPIAAAAKPPVFSASTRQPHSRIGRERHGVAVPASILAALVVLCRRRPMNFRLDGVHSAAERAGGPPMASAFSDVFVVCAAT